MPAWDSVWVNARIATMASNGRAWGEIPDGVIGVSEGRIIWVGARSELAAMPPETRVFDAGGRWITPGLIDCHTHLVFAGNRDAEFEQRLRGATYTEIAAAGGGIGATMRATRAASRELLLETGLDRLHRLAMDGVTTVEIKSGYGLETETEIKSLQVARQLGKMSAVNVITTFLGAHATPPEFADDPESYVDLVCNEMLPAVHERGLADAVDAYCESLAFTPDQVRRIFGRARSLGLPVKLHADQFSDSGGAALAAEFDALSADHLEYTSARGVAALAAAGTAAVLLPGAFYMLREPQLPPVTALQAVGVPIALATDLNPGTSPVYSLTAMMNMGCVLFGLTPEQALAGVTRNAAAALGLTDRGTLEVGRRADLAVWNVEHPRELSVRLGRNTLERIVIGGAVIDDDR